MFQKEKKKKSGVTVHVIPLDQTSIRPDGRKRMPWLGRRIGKLLRKHSSNKKVNKKRPSIFGRFKPARAMDSSSHSFSSSSGTPSPKLSSSPRRSESLKDKHWRKPVSSKRKQTPVSPLARSTSPVTLNSILTPNTSPPGSMHSLHLTTPPSSPKTDRYIFTDITQSGQKKSVSTGELLLSTNPNKKTSPHTSPLLKRAISPSPEQHIIRSNKPRRSSTLERTTNIHVKKESSNISMI